MSNVAICELIPFKLSNIELRRKISNLYGTFYICLEKLSISIVKRKGRYLTQSYDKSPYTHRKIQKQSDNTKTPPKTTIADRLRTVSWSDDSHPTGVIKLVYETPTPSNHKSCVIKRTNFICIVYILHL